MPQSTVKIIKQLILFVYIQIQIQIFKMDQFRIQLVKQSPPLPAPTAVKIAPKLNITINSITCLNYPIEALSQVLAAHFDEQPCPANLVFKALKIISISLKDKELRESLQRILMTNLHKRQKIYNLFVLWTNTTPNLISILTKIDMKLVENLLGVIFAYYCFTNTAYNSNISQLLSSLTSQLSPESVNKINQYTKNEFMAMDYPIDVFLNCTNKFTTIKESPPLQQFLSSLSSSVCKFQQSESRFRTILSLYLKDQSVKSKIDEYFAYFPQLTQFFINNFSVNINKTQVIDIWFNSFNYKLEQPIRAAVKQWISEKHHLWQTINHNFNNLRQQKQVKKLQKLLELGSQIDSTALSNLIIKKYIYNFFTNLNSEPDLDKKLIYQMSQNKQMIKKIHSGLQTMSQIVKSIKNIHRNGNVNILVINKILAPDNWDISGLEVLNSMKNKKNKDIIEKLIQVYGSVEELMLEKGKKIQIAFHVINVQYLEDTGAKKSFFVTIKQLSDILKTGTLTNLNGFIDEYRALTAEQKKTQKKDIHSIVIEAKIVRILKRSKSKLLFKEIYDQVIKQLDISEESFRLSMQKVVSKSLAQLQEGGTYIYSP